VKHLGAASAAGGRPTSQALRILAFGLVKNGKRATYSIVKLEAVARVVAEPRVFATTRGSLILSATDSDADEQKKREALA